MKYFYRKIYNILNFLLYSIECCNNYLAVIKSNIKYFLMTY